MADSDAQLVKGYLGGSGDALAAIYDRYADALHDTAAAMLSDRHEAADVTHDVFVIAAERLGQLRDPAKLRSWLFAILRHEVYRRSRHRRRERPVDLAAAGGRVGGGMGGTVGVVAMAAPVDPRAEGAGVEYADLADELREAARGLDARDQLVLELTARQGLGGEELAGALGVSVAQSYVIVSRMRDRVERSLGALAVTRAGRRDCPELDGLLAGWDGTLSVLVRKRIARHVESCATCTRTRGRVGVMSLVAAAPALAAPAALRERVLSRTGAGPTVRSGDHDAAPWGRDGFPPAAATARRLPTLLASACAAVALLAGGLLVARSLGDSDDPSADPTVPTAAALAPTTAGDLAVASPAPTTPTTSTVAPATTDAGVVTAAPPGPPTAPPSAPPTAPPSPPTGPPTVPPVPPSTAALAIVVVTAAETDPPRVEIIGTTPGAPCPSAGGPIISALVTDASPVSSVELSWTGPGPPGGRAMARGSDGRWAAPLAVGAVNGTWAYLVTATDAHGNTGTASATMVISGC